MSHSLFIHVWQSKQLLAGYVPDCVICDELVKQANQQSADCTAADNCCTYEVSTCDCFPGTATVQLRDGSTKLMRDLAVGDAVLAGPGGQYSEVYMFSHRLVDAEVAYVELETASATVHLTGGHYLPVNGARLAEARTVRVGDNVTLGASGKSVPVVAVRSVRKGGLYNPHTLHGDIVVDGVLTSTYTAAFSPTLAHVVLAPLRALYRAGVDVFKADVGSALDALPSWWTRRFQLW